MLVLFLCLLSLTPAATEVGLGGKVLLFPTKTNTSYVELFPEKPLSLSAFTLCMRVATELQGEREVILFAYRTPQYDELNVWREKGQVSLYLRSSSEAAFFHLPPLSIFQTHLCVTWDSETGLSAFWVDGRWVDGRQVSLYLRSSSEAAFFHLPPLSIFQTHLCVTWDSETGLSAFWVDGRSLFQLYRKGHSVLPGGTVLLGQDPDKYLGAFDAEQSFIGEITDVEMWDHVLSGSQIKAVYSNQEPYVPKGNVFDWNTIKYETNGNVLVVQDY
ncbi:Pentraxin fusion protein [Anabarilius grahami]|uniref:Pentraxin fusion protein n=1 Tax=Anabarilius grahami TaxID=495550 RepID=A0A3N0XGI8_ANAGA|nr:Pentraxin fusion protein [Anabarilius grahami]